MGSFSCASGSSASAPREMEEAARDRCAGESSFALARASVASIWASARERSGAGTEGTCGRQRGARRGAGRRRRLFAARRLAREIDPIKRRFVEPGGSGGRSAAARARTGEEAVLAQDLRVEGAPGGLGGHASLAAERGGELADDLGAALGHQRGVVIDAQHLQLLRERTGHRCGSARRDAGGGGDECFTRRLGESLRAGGRVVRVAECASSRAEPPPWTGGGGDPSHRPKRRAAKTESEVLFLWLEIFPGDLPNPSRMDKQSAPENHKGYGSHPETNPHANATECIGGPS